MKKQFDREYREDLFWRIIRDISHILCLNLNLEDSSVEELEALISEPGDTDEPINAEHEPSL